MRRAFVFQLSSKATQDHLEGRIEHVDSGRSEHFQSIDDAICFVRQVLADTESAEEQAGIEGELTSEDSNEN
jgi:hypothetical protein